MLFYNRREFLQAFSFLSLNLLLGTAKIPTSSYNPKKLIFQLDWKYNVQFAGVILADYYGLYKQQGLNVEIRPWQPDVKISSEVAENPYIIGCAEQDAILVAQATGKPIKAIATMFQTSPLGLMSLPSRNIKTLQDLKGQKVGLHQGGKKVMKLALDFSHINSDEIEIIPISYEDKYERLQTGELAAIQCYIVDEPIEFKTKKGINPTILSFKDWGYDAYVQVIFAHQELLKKHPKTVQSFLNATFQGWKLALADISKTAELIVNHYITDSHYENLDYQTESLKIIANYLTDGVNLDHLGYISPQRWQTMSERFFQYEIIPDLLPLSKSLDYRFLPA